MLQHLPADVLHYLLCFLSNEEVGVLKRIKTFFYPVLFCCEIVRLTGAHMVSDYFKKDLPRAKRMQFSSFYGRPNEFLHGGSVDNGLRWMTDKCKNIIDLELTSCNVHDSAMYYVSRTCKKIQRLRIASCNELTHKTMDHIGTMSTLQHIMVLEVPGMISNEFDRISCTDIERGTRGLKYLSQLESVSLVDIGKLSDLTLYWLSFCTQLKVLQISGSFTTKGVSNLRFCKSLTKIDLCDCTIQIKESNEFTTFTGIKWGTKHVLNKFTDEIVDTMVQLPLVCLTIQNCHEITDDAAERLLDEIPTLQKMQLHGLSLSDYYRDLEGFDDGQGKKVWIPVGDYESEYSSDQSNSEYGSEAGSEYDYFA